jgi:TonB-linked SusC/RagA family outer membrane protein
VTDAESGEPLPGVNVVIEGTQQGAATGADGTYEITGVEAGTHAVTASFVGYADTTRQGIEVQANQTTMVDFALTRSAAGLEEVVVVGYGRTRQEEDIVGGISTVNIEGDNLVEINTPDVGDLLKGRTSGVQVREGTGAAGSSPTIRVRGVSSINAGVEPLVVVDGVPVGTGIPNTLSPDAISSISVLKDASSTSIYGARASNGVVVIKTREGRAGESSLSYTASYTAKQLPESWRPQLLNAEEAVRYNIRRIRDLNGFNNSPTPPDIPEIWIKKKEELEDGELKGYDWLDEFVREGVSSPSAKHNLTYNTGSENIRAAVSGGYLKEKSVIPSDDFGRLSLRTNVDANISDKVNLVARISGSRTVNDRVPTDGHRNALWAAITASPVLSPYNEDGSLKPFMRAPAPGFFTRPNPMFQVKEILNKQTQRKLTANISLDYEIINGLSYTPRIYAIQQNSEIEQFEPTTIGNVSIGGEGNLIRGAPPQNNGGSKRFAEVENRGIDNIIEYNYSFESHSIDVTLGSSIQKENGESERISASIFPSDEIVDYQQASETQVFSNDFDWSLIAGFGEARYDYNDKYIAEIGFRREGSSRLGANERFGNFPSGAIGWRVSEEEFYPDNIIVDNLLLRGSIGKTGNNSIGNFEALGVFNSRRTVIGDQVREGQTLSELPNESLKWETAVQWQIASTVGMFDGLIRLKTEYWKKTTQDMLFDVRTPRASGFSTTRVNFGNMINQGVDATLELSKNISDDLSFSSMLNASWKTNEVTDIPPQTDRIVLGGRGGTNIIQEGDELGAFWGLIRDGLWRQDNIDDTSTPHATFAGQDRILGTNRFRDLNGDGVIDRENDFTVIGDPRPDVVLGLRSNISYNNFSFSFLLSSMLGYEILPTIRDVDMNTVRRWNVSKRVLNRWKSPENPGDGFAPRSEVNSHAREWMDDWLEPGDHLWVKNIRVAYNIPSSLSTRLGVTRARFFITVDNLARIDSYSGFNPEVSVTSDPRRPGLDRYVNPVPRSYSIGVNISL